MTELKTRRQFAPGNLPPNQTQSPDDAEPRLEPFLRRGSQFQRQFASVPTAKSSSFRARGCPRLVKSRSPATGWRENEVLTIKIMVFGLDKVENNAVARSLEVHLGFQPTFNF